MSDDDPRTMPDDEDFGPALQAYLAGDRHALEALPAGQRRLGDHLASLLAARHLPPASPGAARQPAPSAGPPRERDPIAVALGLVAGPADVLSSSRLQHARKQRGMSVADLAAALSARGWDIATRDVFRWHQHDTSLPPAQLQALADVLAVTVSELRSQATGRAAPADWLDDDAVAAVVDAWARDTGEDPERLRRRAGRQLASLNYRNRDGEFDRDFVVAVLRAMRQLEADTTDAGGE